MIPLTSFSTIVKERFTPVFVSGAPRSGTTVCHSLICTSNEVNDYVPESSYLTGIMDNFEKGVNFPIHNDDLFGSRQNLTNYGIEEISNLLTYLWMRLETPKILCLKDPLMIKHFNWIHKVFPNVKYVITIRSPDETISSKITVEKKLGNNINEDLISLVSKELLGYLQLILKLQETISERLILISYDSILDLSAIEKLKKLKEGIDFSPGNIWKSKFVENVQRPSPWITPKYGSGLENIEKSSLVLSPKEIDIVNSICYETYSKIIPYL